MKHEGYTGFGYLLSRIEACLLYAIPTISTHFLKDQVTGQGIGTSMCTFAVYFAEKHTPYNSLFINTELYLSMPIILRTLNLRTS